MKLMLWYSVPYMGIRAKKYTQFHGKYLYVDQHRGIAALDPRYACVRQYLVQQYETAVRNWDLDGLKLDFVNAFRLTEDTPVDDPEMDVVSLEEAIERLLQEVTTRLRQLKPELLIEFRQGYIGPAMRSYGNMLRAADCPNDALSNKTAVLDLRLTSGKTPVHSDMLMWHPDEPAEKAALQLASVLFAVPQISVRMEAISLEQKEMLSYYLNFWQKNRKLLLDGTLRLWDPQAFYSKASAQLEGESITVLYTDTVVQKETEKTTAVNCGPERKIYFDDFADAFYRIVDCRGREVARGVLQKLTALVVPCAGMVLIEP
jgi:alpha-galactosidase